MGTYLHRLNVIFQYFCLLYFWPLQDRLNSIEIHCNLENFRYFIRNFRREKLSIYKCLKGSSLDFIDFSSHADIFYLI